MIPDELDEHTPKCAIYSCHNSSRPPFKCCSANNGSYLRVIQSNLRAAFKADCFPELRSFTVEEAEYYAGI